MSPSSGPLTIRLPDADAARAFGLALATVLRAGDVLVLTGDLGAGKTTLTQGLGEGLGVRGPITSPTFVIARVHPSLVGGPALVHVDAYRLGGAVELDDLESVGAQLLSHPVTPFDDDNRGVEIGVEIEVVQLDGAAEPIGIDVDQRRASDQRRVHPRDDEGRRSDRPSHAQTLTEALGERGLPCSEVAGEHEHVTGPKDGRQRQPKRSRRVGIREPDRERSRARRHALACGCCAARRAPGAPCRPA